VRRIQLFVTSSLFSLLVGSCFAEAWPEPNCVESPKLFEKQYADLFRAYKKGDEQAMKAALDGFSIPGDWFTAHFGADKGQEWSRKYAEQLAYFKWDTLRRFQWIDKADGSTMETQVCIKDHPKPLPKPAPASLTLIPETKMYMIRYTKQHGTFELFGRPAHSVGWGDLYTEVDGQYRFFGLGGYPFWDLPPMRLADMCAKQGERTGGELVKRVEPEYTEAARIAGKKGIVRIRLTVSVDGSVTDVEIIDGDSMLIPAAKAAAIQWQYRPWMNCGHPVEMRTVEIVRFPPLS
jgi:TonB family protein